MQKWLLAIVLILNAKKGISSRQLVRDLGVHRNTAWSMQMRIRRTMVDNPSLLMGLVEMDETYIGAKKIRKSSKDKDDDGNYPKNPRGRGKSKTPVVGMLERGGKVIAKIQRNLKFKDLKRTAKEYIDFKNATLLTDDYRGYVPFKHFLIHQSGQSQQETMG